MSLVAVTSPLSKRVIANLVCATAAVSLQLFDTLHIADPTDTFISKTTRLYKDSRSLTNGQQQGGATQLDQLNENLKDVTRIMTKNMEDLLWRGDSLDREYRVLSAGAQTGVGPAWTKGCNSRTRQGLGGRQRRLRAKRLLRQRGDLGPRDHRLHSSTSPVRQLCVCLQS